MKQLYIILLFLLITSTGNLFAQNRFQAIIKSDEEESELLGSSTARVLNTEIAAVADSNGLVILQNIPDGEQVIEFSCLGYFKKKFKITFPYNHDGVPVIKLQSQAQEVAEVVVTTTRNYQKAEYLPTAIDVIGEEEVEEQSHDKPADVSHIMREQTGVQVQRTSATSGTLGIRLQGLSTNYVQLLKDGFPLFGGLSNVISLSQIPPLDLQQIEIIKGPASTLYGGDAIAGVVNLVSKQPTEKPVYDLLFNGESAFAFDGGAYAAQKIKWFAFTLTATYRYQKQKDWSGFGFPETPKLNRYFISPQLFFDLSKHAKVNIGGSYINENRLGGSTQFFESVHDTVPNYYEQNLSERAGGNFKFTYDFEAKGALTLKESYNYFKRDLSLPYYLFRGRQQASAGEINYHVAIKKHDVIIGVDLRTDNFTEHKDSSTIARNYSYLTFGAFAQYMYHFDAKTTAELGLRIDYNNVYKVYPLPHIAFLRRWNPYFDTRLNLGMGYKLPTIFQDQSEEARFINVNPITSSIKPELSLGGTINLKIKLPNFNGVHININQLYFLTHILHPMLGDTASIAHCSNCIETTYKNHDGYTQSGGVETSFELEYRGLQTAIKYTYTDSHSQLDGIRSINPLTSKHILSLLAGYEIKKFFIGIDAYYYSPVKLSDGSIGKGIWEVGISTQYAFKYFVVFANLENIADIRQTSYGPVVFPYPNYSHPQFSEIYAPLEGRLFNAGIKIHLGAFSKKKSSSAEVERLQKKDDD